ncbi:winged helix-turn-helix domain-containing protein [Herbaspirillum seropedicae]|uniref:winged helix-turn-helix domain-containing protein n=1 Tax=Herbaspirillum seropedicae TaxID=964 RepID=UPI003FCE52D5
MKIGLLSSDADTVSLVSQLGYPHDCTHCASLEELTSLSADGVQLLVLDLDDLLPQADELVELVRRLRPPLATGPAPAVLLLATPAHQDWLWALRQAGAQELLVKPVRRQELALRMTLLMRTAEPEEAQTRVIAAGGFLLDLARLRVTHPQRPELEASLTRKEAELALLFLQNLGRPLSRAFLQEKVWGAEPELPTRTIDTHVSRVRTKLGLQPGHGYRLATVYGYGYQLERLD